MNLQSMFLLFVIQSINHLNRQIEMKSNSNKFDYPTAASCTYKKYKGQIDSANSNQLNQSRKNNNKQRYRQVNQQERNNERARVKQEQKSKQQKQRELNKKKLEGEIENRKRQLLELENIKAIAIQADKKSYELAIIRQEQEKVKQINKEKKQKANEVHAQNRFIDALKRLQVEKDEANQKNKEALLRRKIAQNAEQVQREKAMKFREVMQEKQKNIQPEQKRSFKDYKQSLGRTAYAQTVDYTKSHIHNPRIIIRSSEGECGQNALIRAQQKNNLQDQRIKSKKLDEEENRRISLKRGEQAIQKIKLEKQYEQYCSEQGKNAVKYNLNRVQAGKKNQYVGLKPATLAQMEGQRKIRRQEEFEKMFFGDNPPSSFQQPATRYNIEQARLGDTEIPLEPIPLSKGNPRSNQAVISDGHYSFESIASFDNQDKYINHEQSLNPIQQYQEQRLENNYISKSKNKEDLDYSESEQEDYSPN